MANKDDDKAEKPKKSGKKKSIKKAFKPGDASAKPAFFTAEEMDIYCNKVTLEAYIFHGKDVDYDPIHYLEYDPKEKRVDVVMKDATRLDLGVKIHGWCGPISPRRKKFRLSDQGSGAGGWTIVP